MVATVSPSEFVQQLINALSLGSIYALLALGLSMVYGVLGMLNFAYGELVTITGYAMLAATYMGAPFIVVALIGVVAAGLASVLMELVAFRPLRNASFVSLLFTSFAVAQLIQGAFRQAVSVRSRGHPGAGLLRRGDPDRPRAHQRPEHHHGGDRGDLVGGAHDVHAPVAFGPRDARRLADFTTARLMGVRANRVISLAFLISGLLAGIAGVLWIARTTSVNPTTGFVPVIQAFIASVIGGLGNLRGAVLGGFFLGTLEVFLQALFAGFVAALRTSGVAADRRRGPVRAAAGSVRAAGRGGVSMIPGNRLAAGPVGLSVDRAAPGGRDDAGAGVRFDVVEPDLRRVPGQRDAGRVVADLHRQQWHRLVRPRRLHGDRRLHDRPGDDPRRGQGGPAPRPAFLGRDDQRGTRALRSRSLPSQRSSWRRSSAARSSA